jgi:ABC transporter substrate binding protein (PQQ-dependent alcohol dehydrogenase system)
MRSLSTTSVIASILAVAAGLATMPDSIAQEGAPTAKIAYIARENDSFYAAGRSYAGILRRDRKPAIAGAELAIQDSKAIGRAIGVDFVLLTLRLAADDDAAARIRSELDASGAIAAILDLPLDDVKRASVSLGDRALALFNIRHREIALRQETCRTHLFHVIPSQAMLADALSQYLSFKAWRRVLVLEGTQPIDVELSQAFQASAKKFQLRVVGVKKFVLGHDPRQRDQINVPLMTGDTDHDVVFVADAMGEFARYVPYRTAKSRLVVGVEGLMSAAWDGAWERHGAPQLNRRFERFAARPMAEEDWAAWVALRTVVQAVLLSRSAGGAELLSALKHSELRVELYKGAPGSFRSWDRQLRQPILLHTRNAVVDLAPVEGFLHQRHNLDSLGVDESEFRCTR